MRSSSVAVVVLLGTLMSSSLWAEDQQPPSGSAHRACREEIHKLCGQVQSGDGRIRHCIEENMNKFSPSCRASMEEHRKQVAEKHAACKTDVEKFCKDKMDGNGGAMRCLHEHKNELSEPCRQSFPSRPPRASSDLPDGHGPGARPGV